METLSNAAAGVKDAVSNLTKRFTWDKKQLPDLTGRTIMVTGATTGSVGEEAAKAFAEKNAHVIVHGRDEEKVLRSVEGLKAVAGPNAKIDYLLADLTSFRSIRAFAEEYKRRGWPLHVLVNNAGIQAPAGQRGAHTEEGFEITLGTNHFGPAYLTFLLLDVLKASAPSRIVWVTSLGSQLVNPPIIGAKSDRWWGIDQLGWDDLKGEKRNESDWWQYARSKLMNLMMGMHMAKVLEPQHISVFVAHPGLSVTDHFGKADTENKLSSKLIEMYANSPIGQTAESGAIPIEYAAAASELDGKTGSYVGSPELFGLNIGQAHEQYPNAPLARDPAACKRLYEETVRIIKDLDPAVKAEE